MTGSARAPGEVLCDPVLSAIGIPHGFGQRRSLAPADTLFPRQVHGVGVIVLGPESAPPTIPASDDEARVGEADAIVSTLPRRSVGIVTADCVPILAASADGSAVAAIHAGWRGLAAGVIEAGIESLRTRSQSSGLLAAVGPAARSCCYEVDEPVERALKARYAELLKGVLEPGRTGHFQLDLPLLASRILAELGLEPGRIGTSQRICTICDPDRFESHRRDGSSAGRLRHFIRPLDEAHRQG